MNGLIREECTIDDMAMVAIKELIKDYARHEAALATDMATTGGSHERRRRVIYRLQDRLDNLLDWLAARHARKVARLEAELNELRPVAYVHTARFYLKSGRNMP